MSDQLAADSEVSNILVERAFRDAYKVSRELAEHGRSWDHEYTLKELGATLRELTERVEAHDVEKRYDLGLRLLSLTLLFSVKLLEADARGEFDSTSATVEA